MSNGTKSPKEHLFGKKLRLGVIAFILGIMVLTPIAIAEKNPNPGVIPVNSNTYGKTYGEWSAEWWKWALSIPDSKNPVKDESGKFGAEGQSGKVWFLAGTWGKTGVSRICTIPAGKALFFPIVNYECSKIEGNGNNKKELLANTTPTIDNVTVKEVKVDGKSLKKLDKYRVTSKLFVFRLPPDNVLGIPTGPRGSSSIAVSDGYWIMLEPLPAGKHTIEIHGEIKVSDDFTFKTQVTYYLTVKPERRRI
jgi:hypothetical protein